MSTPSAHPHFKSAKDAVESYVSPAIGFSHINVALRLQTSDEDIDGQVDVDLGVEQQDLQTVFLMDLKMVQWI
jgi:hypothetical protein